MWYVNWYQWCGHDPEFYFKPFPVCTTSHLNFFYLPCGYATASQNPFHCIAPAITRFLVNHLLSDTVLLSNGLGCSSPLLDTWRSLEASAGGKSRSHLSSRAAEHCKSASSPAARNRPVLFSGFLKNRCYFSVPGCFTLPWQPSAAACGWLAMSS